MTLQILRVHMYQQFTNTSCTHVPAVYKYFVYTCTSSLQICYLLFRPMLR